MHWPITLQTESNALHNNQNSNHSTSELMLNNRKQYNYENNEMGNFNKNVSEQISITDSTNAKILTELEALMIWIRSYT
jgi:hypothetical protein